MSGPASVSPAPAPPSETGDDQPGVAALAKGGRTNFLGFLLRLVARLPFLYFAGRWYGPDALGRFALAVLVVEFAAQLATLGLKRGLAEQLSREHICQRTVVWDGMFVAMVTASIAAGALMLFPQAMFPVGQISEFARWFPLVIIAITGTEVALAACAYRYNVGATVWARSFVEPWVISIAAFGFAYVTLENGLLAAYATAMVAAFLTALVPLFHHYGVPRGWRPHPAKLLMVARANAPLAGADAIEWATRRLDLAILGLFTAATPAIYGIYYIAQQVASLPQKLKTSFEPILGPVITRNLAAGRKASVAGHISQVGFWIIAAQAGVALALGIPAESILALVGPEFMVGAAALAFLLAAEVIAATAVVSESALVYLARVRNLLISTATLVLQAVLSVAFILIAKMLDLPPINYAIAVAAALMCALAFASVVKARLAGQLLGAPINPWRWALAWAIGGAAVLGWALMQLPEWAALIFGVPMILIAYGWFIWRRGFGPADRALFQLSRAAPDPPPVQPSR